MTENAPLWLALAAACGALAGALLAWLLLRGAAAAARAELQPELAAGRERVRALEEERLAGQKALDALRRQADGWRDALDAARDERAQLGERAARVPVLEKLLATRQAEAAAAREESVRLQSQLTEARAALDAERARMQAHLQALAAGRAEMADQFKALASDILEEKGRRFAAQNEASLGQLVQPLKERMGEFRQKVEEIHARDLEQQAALRAELGQLKELNRQMSDEAHGLAMALRGQAKVQGNWGELVLANVLERAGLREGADFRREVSFETEEGRRRPDVVLSLPQDKHLVIDAKVSLNAYTRYVNAEDEAERAQALREHVQAVLARIHELADRSYFSLPGLNTPEVVFLFIPVESAFMEAARADGTLVQRAIERNILVATPATLLTSLHIVRQLWRLEAQNAHTAELADRAGKVVRKLASFVASMESVGRQLDKARESYGQAMGQLVNGRGNLIQQAREFERLGVAVQAQLPAHLVAAAALELERTAPTLSQSPAEAEPSAT